MPAHRRAKSRPEADAERAADPSTDRPRRRRRRVVVGGLCLGLVGATGIGVIVHNRQSPPADPTAAVAGDDRSDRASRGDTRSAPPTAPPSASPSASPAAPPSAASKATRAGSSPTASTSARRTTTSPPPLPAPAGCTSYSGNRRIGCSLLSSFGFSLSEMPALDQLWAHESGWNQFADNPSSGAYGIPQALPGSRMVSAGADWRTNAATQIKWGLGYIRDRYGSPSAAWSFWQANGWY